MARVLRSSVRQYQQQQRYSAIALAQAQRSWRTRNFDTLIQVLMFLQNEIAKSAFDAVDEMLEEQQIVADPVATPDPGSLVGFSSGGATLDSLVRVFEEIDRATLDGLEQTVLTEVADTARVAESVAITIRPTIDGHVRYLNPPSCGRCVVLAGRVYPWSTGFLRHENCDCFMVPVSAEVNAVDLFTDPDEAYRLGQVKGLTKAQQDAINEGANMADVINVARKKAGLRVAGRVLERGGRLTPEGIYALASDRDEAIALLKREGYLR